MRQQRCRVFPTHQQIETDITLDSRHTRVLRTRLLSGIAIGVLACTTARAQQDQTGAPATSLTPSVPVSGSGAPASAPATKTVHHRRSPAARAKTASAAPSAPVKDTGEVVIVSAQRRNQNLQDVPVSIQVLTGETLKRLNIENFDDMLNTCRTSRRAGSGRVRKTSTCAA